MRKQTLSTIGIATLPLLGIGAFMLLRTPADAMDCKNADTYDIFNAMDAVYFNQVGSYAFFEDKEPLFTKTTFKNLAPAAGEALSRWTNDKLIIDAASLSDAGKKQLLALGFPLPPEPSAPVTFTLEQIAGRLGLDDTKRALHILREEHPDRCAKRLLLRAQAQNMIEAINMSKELYESTQELIAFLLPKLEESGIVYTAANAPAPEKAKTFTLRYDNAPRSIFEALQLVAAAHQSIERNKAPNLIRNADGSITVQVSP